MLVRGGISSGKLVHKGSNVYGPALIDAYELECEKAKFPRIILDSTLAEDWGRNIPVLDNDSSLIGHEKIWRKDEDGYIFYDFLQPHSGIPGIEVDSSCIDNILAPYRKLIIDGLERYRDDVKVFPKYKWGANYLNSVLSEYPQSSLETIEVM